MTVSQIFGHQPRWLSGRAVFDKSERRPEAWAFTPELTGQDGLIAWLLWFDGIESARSKRLQPSASWPGRWGCQNQAREVASMPLMGTMRNP